ncbi:alcohol dehydrogenase catalytic domain-containing protein [Oricola cellulosilytica]|nr:zinc-binding dehydrogenase [Oricola cellulosilytica]
MSELPSRMKALVQLHSGFTDKPEPFKLETMAPYVALEEIAVPEPGDDQVVVKVAAASVNPSDVMFIKGMYGQPRREGVPAGFEGVGEVVGGKAAGEGLVGKRVAFTGTGSGTWAEYAITDASVCIPLMEGIRDEDGAALIVNPMTAIAMFGIVKDEGQKSFVMTAGASQLCKLIIGLAAQEGYRPIVTVRRDEQIEPLKALGAVHALNEKAADFHARMAEILREEKPRIFLDAVTGDLAATIFHAMGGGARWIIYGRLDESLPVIKEPGHMIFLGKRIEGFWLVRWMREAGEEGRIAAVMEVQKQFLTGNWSTDISARLSLEEAMEGLPGALAVPNGKVFIVP